MAVSRADRVEFLQRLIDCIFNDPAIVEEALRAAGVRGTEGNKSLALVGDTALQLFLQTQGLRRQMARGRISQVVSQIAGNTNLAQRGFELGLDRYIEKNPSQGTMVSDGLMATTMEAIIGAVFVDSNWDPEALGRAIAGLGLSWPEC